MHKRNNQNGGEMREKIYKDINEIEIWFERKGEWDKRDANIIMK